MKTMSGRDAFPSRERPKLLTLTLIITALLALVTGAWGNHLRTAKVLLLHTLGPEDPWTTGATEGIRDVFSEKNLQSDLFVEYLDGAKTREFAAKKNLRDLLEAKFLSAPPALIIATGNEASIFALNHSKSLFGEAPVVFCNLSNEKLIPLFLGKGTGVSAAPPFDFLLSEIERFHPQGTTIAFISDSVAAGLGKVTMLIKSLSSLPRKLKPTLMVGLSQKALAEDLKKLPHGTVIILDSPSLPRDQGGVSLKEMLAFIRLSTSLPVYTLDEEGVKFGALGSVRNCGYEKGRRSGKLAVRILSGESPKSIPPDYFRPNGLVFDYRAMRTHHIENNSLSQGAVVLNDPYGHFKKHRPLFILLFLVLFTLTALFATLVLFLRKSIARRKKAEGELTAKTEYWEELFQRSPEGVIVYDGKGKVLETNSIFRSTFALSEADLFEASLATLLPWKSGTLPYQRFFPSDVLESAEVLIPDKDGLLIPSSHLAFPLFKGEENLYCSLIQNVSKIKKREKQLEEEKLFQEALSSIASRFILSPSYQEAMTKALEDILNVTRAKNCAIFTLDEKKEAFSLDIEVLFDEKSPSFSALFPSKQEDDFFWKYFLFRRKNWDPIYLNFIKLPGNQKSDWSPLIERGVSSLFVLPLHIDNALQGFLALGNSFPEGEGVKGESFLPILRDSLAASVERNLGDIFLESSTSIIKDRFTGIVMALCQVSELRDVSTAGHQKNVAFLAENLARRMSLPEDAALAVRYAGLVHDIGKLYIPPEILAKPANLTPTEYALVKQHPEYGGSILSSLDFPWPLAEIVVEHHERMDGKGYPRGLKGEEISVEGRIISVADAFDAMTSERPYRQKKSPSEALAEIVLMAGTAYDPEVVEALKAYCRDSFQI